MKILYTILLVLLYNITNAQPINDSPCIDNTNPPYFLGYGGTHTGTTCGAIGYNDDPNEDKKNVKCNGATDDNAVWYRAKYNPAFDGININITKGSIGALASVEVFVGDTNAICNNTAIFSKAKCDGLPVIDMHIGCLEDGDYVFIKVTSKDSDCGTFDISVEGINDCKIADACEDITGAQKLNPVTPEDVVIEKVCLQACLDLACPDTGLPGCEGFNTEPTVWFQVNTDADAAQLYSFVSTSGSWTPIWSVFFSPTNDCADLQNAAGTGSFPCSLDAVPEAPPLITGVTEGIYYIAVSADPDGQPIDNPNFEICVATIKNIVVCLGPDLGCGNDESLVFEVTERENTDAEPDGPPYNGPFCQGEEVTVHMQFTYDATQTGDDWFIGLVPKFGPGWDMGSFDFAGNPPTGTPMGAAEWYDENGDCAPVVTEKFSHLCTYTDDAGHLRLCNVLCENCPCSTGMVEQDPLPSGYFWVQEGHTPDCDTNNCSPSRKFGIGTPISIIDWTINLKVKEFSTQDECLENDDLLINFMTFSDGGAGCWDDAVAECLLDKPQFSPPWKVNCQIPPGVIGTPQPRDICSGTEAGIDVTTKNGSTELIEVTFEDNPNVGGESNHSFPDGFGTIDDLLTITNPDSCDVEIVTYYAQVITEDMTCQNKIDTFVVVVHPVPIIRNQDVTQKISIEELPYTLHIVTDCGYTGYYTYNWEDKLSDKSGIGDSIVIDSSFELGLHTFSITISDELGCNNTGQLSIEVLDTSKLVVNSQKIDVSCFGECDGTISIINVVNSTPPLSYNWSNGDTSALINKLCAGEFFVTITDKKSNFIIDTIVIDQPDEIIITVDSITNITGSNDGGIFTTTNNNGHYAFSWTGPEDFSANTQNISNLKTPGCYTFEVKDTTTNCTRDTTICIEDKTSSIDISKKKSAYIIPNPNTGEFDLILEDISPGKLKVELISNKGEKLYTNRYMTNGNQKSLRFNFDSYPGGIYFLKLITKDKLEVIKFVHR